MRIILNEAVWGKNRETTKRSIVLYINNLINQNIQYKEKLLEKAQNIAGEDNIKIQDNEIYVLMTNDLQPLSRWYYFYILNELDLGKTKSEVINDCKYDFGFCKLYIDECLVGGNDNIVDTLRIIICFLRYNPTFLETVNGFNYQDFTLSELEQATAEQIKEWRADKFNRYKHLGIENVRKDYYICKTNSTWGLQNLKLPNNQVIDVRKYTNDWCIANKSSYIDGYIGNTGVFYICVHKNFKKISSACYNSNFPLDKYGLSMLAISVSQSGDIQTVTTRWNHAGGANDHSMNDEQLAKFFNADPYQLFPPSSETELQNNGEISIESILQHIQEKDFSIFDTLVKFGRYKIATINNNYYVILPNKKLLLNTSFTSIEMIDDDNEIASIKSGDKTNYMYMYNKRTPLIWNQPIENWFDEVMEEPGGFITVRIGNKYNISNGVEMIWKQPVKYWFDDCGYWCDEHVCVEINNQDYWLTEGGYLYYDEDDDEPINPRDYKKLFQRSAHKKTIDETFDIYNKNKNYNQQLAMNNLIEHIVKSYQQKCRLNEDDNPAYLSTDAGGFQPLQDVWDRIKTKQTELYEQLVTALNEINVEVNHLTQKYSKDINSNTLLKFLTMNKIIKHYKHIEKDKKEDKLDFEIPSILVTAGNGKLPENILIINITSSLFCSSFMGNLCKVPRYGCYAQQDENQYPSVRQRRWKTELLHTAMLEVYDKHPEIMNLYFDIIEEYIQIGREYSNKLIQKRLKDYSIMNVNLGDMTEEEKNKYFAPERKYVITDIRINEAGDFPNQLMVNLYSDFAKRMKTKYNITTHAYTARTLDYADASDNINLNFSRKEIKNGKGPNRYYVAIGEKAFEKLEPTELLAPGKPELKTLQKDPNDPDNVEYYYKCPTYDRKDITCRSCRVCFDKNETGHDYTIYAPVHRNVPHDILKYSPEKMRGLVTPIYNKMTQNNDFSPEELEIYKNKPKRRKKNSNPTKAKNIKSKKKQK